MNLDQFFSHWDQVHQDTLTTFGKFMDADLQFTPFPSSWSVGQIMLHIPDTEEGWLRFVVERKYPHWPEQFTLENYPTISAIQDALADVHRLTWGYLTSLDETDLDRLIDTPSGEKLALGWIIWHVLEHEVHHRGELSLILGLLGREGLDV